MRAERTVRAVEYVYVYVRVYGYVCMRMYVVHTLVETFTGGNVEHEIMNMKGVTDRPAPAPASAPAPTPAPTPIPTPVPVQ